MQAWRDDVSFRDQLAADPRVTSAMSQGQFDAMFDLSYHLRHVDTAYERLGLA